MKEQNGVIIILMKWTPAEFITSYNHLNHCINTTLHEYYYYSGLADLNHGDFNH